MLSIIITIDSINKLFIGDYVEFHYDKLVYIKYIVKNFTVRIIEADETTRSRYYLAWNNQCKVILLTVQDPTGHRSILKLPNQKK